MAEHWDALSQFGQGGWKAGNAQGLELDGLLGYRSGVVGDALKIGVNSQHRGDFTEITGKRVVQGQNAEGLFFNVNFKLVYGVVAGDNFAGLFNIELEQRIHRRLEHADGDRCFLDDHPADKFNLNVDSDLLSRAEACRRDLIGGGNGRRKCRGR